MVDTLRVDAFVLVVSMLEGAVNRTEYEAAKVVAERCTPAEQMRLIDAFIVANKRIGLR